MPISRASHCRPWNRRFWNPSPGGGAQHRIDGFDDNFRRQTAEAGPLLAIELSRVVAGAAESAPDIPVYRVTEDVRVGRPKQDDCRSANRCRQVSDERIDGDNTLNTPKQSGRSAQPRAISRRWPMPCAVAVSARLLDSLALLVILNCRANRRRIHRNGPARRKVTAFPQIVYDGVNGQFQDERRDEAADHRRGDALHHVRA